MTRPSSNGAVPPVTTRPPLSRWGARLVERTQPIAVNDDQYGWAHAILCEAMSKSYAQVGSIADPPDPLPPLAPLLDANLCPAWALPWLAQFVGVQIPRGATEQLARGLLINRASWGRGTRQAMAAAASVYLGGSKTVYFRERDESPYRLEVVTLRSEVPESDWLRPDVDLIYDPGFETDAPPWVPYENEYGGGDVTWERSQEQVRSGGYAAKVNADTSEMVAGVLDDRGVDITWTPHPDNPDNPDWDQPTPEYLHGSAWLYIPSTSHQGTPYITLSFRDAEGNDLGIQSGGSLDGGAPLDQWFKIELDYPATPYKNDVDGELKLGVTAHIGVYLTMPGQNADPSPFWIDDVMVASVPAYDTPVPQFQLTSKVYDALNLQKPGGIKLAYRTTESWDWQQVVAENETWSAVIGDFPTWANLITKTGGP